MRITLEEILKKYKFAQKSKQLFRKNRIYIDDLPEDMTTAGAKAYYKLISLLYDIANLTGHLKEVNILIDTLDQITTEE